MARRITPDQLSASVGKILQEYGDDIQDNLTDIVSAITKKGVQAVKSGARASFKGTGAYAKGWTSELESGRYSAQGFIFNGDLPGLPHLLEFGHANRGGGRTPGRTHIAPVEETLVKEFERQVKSKL